MTSPAVLDHLANLEEKSDFKSAILGDKILYKLISFVGFLPFQRQKVSHHLILWDLI